MSTRPATLLACALALLTYAQVPLYADDWIDFKALEGALTVRLPADPSESIFEIPLADEKKMKLHDFTWTGKDGRAYDACWCDYPDSVTATMTTEQIYDLCVLSYKLQGKKIIADKAITLHGKLAHYLETEVEGGIIRQANFLLSGNRMYAMIASSSAADRNDPDIAKFLDSFSFIDPLDFSTRGFRIDSAALAKWHPAIREESQTVASWNNPDSTAKDVKAYITIEMRNASDSAADKTAAALAKSWGGKVADEKIILDGEAAFKVTAKSLPKGNAKNAPKNLRPVEAIVVTHHGYTYTIVGEAKPDVDCEKNIAEIAKEWRWCELTPVADHLWLGRIPVPILNGLAEINIPADMFLNPAKTPAASAELSLNDAQNKNSPFHITLEIKPSANRTGFYDRTDAFLKALDAQKSADEPFKWLPLYGDHRRITNCIHSAEASRIAKHETSIIFAVFELDEKQMAQLKITITAANEKDRAKYEAAAKAIVGSIQTLAAP